MTVSASPAATTYHYLVDLRIVCRLLCESRPAAADLAPGHRAELIEAHVTERRTQIAAGYHTGGRRRDATSTPPTTSASRGTSRAP